MTRPDRTVDGPDDWHRLSAWMIALKPIEQLPQLIPLIIALVFAGRNMPNVAALVGIVVVPLVALLPWLTTRYQVTDEHVRLRSGVFTRTVSTARRDRIRSVDLTASLPHRLLQLSTVRIGTGGDDKASTVELSAIRTVEADHLRELLTPGSGLIDQATGAPHEPGDGDEPRIAVAPRQPPEVLARFHTSWLRFAPFSLTGLAAVAAVVGVGFQIGNDLNLLQRGASAAEGALRRIQEIPLPAVVAAAVAIVIVGGALVSLVGYVVGNWAFTVTRDPEDSTLRVTRGLLTTFSTSLDERRIRGVHIHEPVLIRPLRGATLHAVATGSTKHPVLLPPAPADEAVRLADRVAGEAPGLTTELTRHSAGARRRRLTRGAIGGVVVIVVAAVAVVGPLTWPWLIVGAVGLVVSTGFGLVRYQHLGHALTDRSVVVATPQVARHRYVIERSGVIGWSTRQSVFQRRQGVETLVLATAAGSEGYALIDMEPATSVALAARVTPDLIAPFVETGV
ncbi:PH domain-containing protein [Gordonia soli]|uniref:YdbS-like PH domain-containing protein n=1 Tax=Gordonia soli NBRC 108243 TaxID=1223545 RepID=M0QEC9_9ACTN|nr:PH domain-containing protein [Gordonia soli]GAC66686.1 hypothetical protein GS4_03_01340 [Gordonia soli NBRC 108243]